MIQPPSGELSTWRNGPSDYQACGERKCRINSKGKRILHPKDTSNGKFQRRGGRQYGIVTHKLAKHLCLTQAAQPADECQNVRGWSNICGRGSVLSCLEVVEMVCLSCVHYRCRVYRNALGEMNAPRAAPIQVQPGSANSKASNCDYPGNQLFAPMLDESTAAWSSLSHLQIRSVNNMKQTQGTRMDLLEHDDCELQH